MRATPIVSALAAVGLVLALLAPPGSGQPAGNDEQAIRAAVAAYTVAMNKGDLAAISDAWATDAQYVAADGSVLKGRATIVDRIKKSLGELKGATYNYTTTEARIFNGSVAVQDGAASTKTVDSESSGRFTAIWAKGPDRWRIAQVRELSDATPTAVAEAETPPSPLKELDWLVGEWVTDKGGITVKISRVLDGSFLMSNYTSKAGGDDAINVVELVGYDPLTESLKSWTFDSRGGYGEALWLRDGNSWVQESVGVLANGAAGSSRNVVKFVDDNTILYQARDREIEGQPIADSEIKLTRKAQ